MKALLQHLSRNPEMFLFSLVSGALLSGAMAMAQPATEDSSSIWIGEIRGTINPASSSYFRTTIKRAETAKADAVVFELDTPGGLLTSVREMVQVLDQASIPVVIYVTPAGASATSAGALLMLGAHVTAMAPGTNIGAAHPVGPQGEDIQGAMGEKVTSDTAAFARSIAKQKNRNVELAEAIVAKSRSFTAEEALKNRLIEFVAPSAPELLKQLHGRKVQVGETIRTIRTEGASIQRPEMTIGQKLLHLLANPNIAGLLMTIGLMLIYVEISNPGITIAGVLGGICLLVAFMSFQLLPIRTGGLLLLALGAILLVAELVVVSGGALAFGGILSFVLGLIWVIDPSSTSAPVSQYVWIAAGLTLGSLVVLIGIAAARMKRLTRKTLDSIGGGEVLGLAGYHGTVEFVDSSGHRGKALIRGELWDFECKDAVSAGDSIEAIETAGMHVVARKVP